MSFIILTERGDFHGHIVKCAMRELGQETSLVYPDEFPATPSLSLCYDRDGSYQLRISDTFEFKDVDCIWMRRLAPPKIDDRLDEINAKYTYREYMSMIESFYYQLSTEFKCINPYPARQATRRKGYQLFVAQKVGLQTPRTLITNDTANIRAFIEGNSHQTLVKPFYSQVWTENDNSTAFYATAIEDNDLPVSPTVVQPNIFQEKIAKISDIRIVAFGNHFVAAKITTDLPPSVIDYKEYPNAEMSIEDYDVPDKILTQCIQMMKKMGIVFGIFDFIETASGALVFLEVNESAQFLFIEHSNPDIRLLDCFCQFLQFDGDPFTFASHIYKPTIKYNDFQSDAWHHTKFNNNQNKVTETQDVLA